ncbi:Uncharacterized membrane protein YqaE, homolog of Blt101, UPF0057 family [Saccharicrinis carchari]|uniref:Uncharacterized membrane protein YqaE, homolog of Blt101, UPF0057 family n=1 Tax=Saccharicrinis carchari TaxID=1168039 RepID=A0A521C1T6_SACCC|nr:YqaE/Pmp3 family membrane protein [Saccharicrinis carchari]SMO53348.1 Uncharacterized membrane protein YqaE, homolog of Blt101, UPF0057 family [Saccharicrinis carchari]
MRLIEIIFAILIPPVGVALAFGIGKRFWISFILTLLGYIPGVIHALIVLSKPK